MQFVKSNDIDVVETEDLEEIELIGVASSIKGSRVSLDKVGNKLEVALPDIRRKSNVSFTDEENWNTRPANARRPTVVSLLNSRVPRHSVFSTTSDSTVDFKQTMDSMKILIVIILIFIFCVFMYNWLMGDTSSQKVFSNSTSINDLSFSHL